MGQDNLSSSGRLISLDAYRGLTMFLLIAEAALVYQTFLNAFSTESFGHTFFTQFTHHPWNGLRFWDLIQPFFMFIVGVAMPFSLNKRLAIAGDRGESNKTYFETLLFTFSFWNRITLRVQSEIGL
jgi:predicted acyltransferase